METFLYVALALYLSAMFFASIAARKKVVTESDFLVAGRRLSMPFATATLFTTWFGAGTLLTATDEIARTGMWASSLEPYGAGACLIIAGLFFAKPLWKLNILTIADFFRIKFGKRAEQLMIFLITPGFIGWIAVQLISAAHMVNIFIGIPVTTALVAVMVIVTIFTLVGGMWSIAIIDFVQMIMITLGLLTLFVTVMVFLGAGDAGAGFASALRLTGQSFMDVPLESKLLAASKYLNIFFISALGNIAGQDFTQRIFSARSASIAQKSCLVAGVSYLMVGTMPAMLGIVSKSILVGDTNLVLIVLASKFLGPYLYVIFVLSIMASVLSTLDSSILATASPLSHNILARFAPKNMSSIRLCQISVVVISSVGFLVALTMENIYDVLEAAYSSGLAMFFSLMVIGIYGKRHHPNAAITAMITGALLWSLDLIVSVDGFSFALIACAASFAAYYAHVFVSDRLVARQPPMSKKDPHFIDTLDATCSKSPEA